MNKPFLEEKNKPTPYVPFFSMVIIPGHGRAHFHEDLELILVEKGDISITLDTEVFHASPGDICIIVPNQIHAFVTSDFAVLYTFKINWNIISSHTNFSKYVASSPIIKKATCFNEKLHNYFHLAIDEYRNRKEGSDYVLCACSNMLLAEITRSNYLVLKNEVKNNTTSSDFNFISSVNAYIDTHFAEPISSADMAEQLNYSKYYFMHLFKKVTGTTFTSFLTDYRLKKATELLLHSDKKTYIIAIECGFTNTRSFYKAFKEVYGMTTSDYIKKYRIYRATK